MALGLKYLIIKELCLVIEDCAVSMDMSCIDLVPSGTQATTTAGNIAAVYTLTSGTLYRACYQGTKWYIK